MLRRDFLIGGALALIAPRAIKPRAGMKFGYAAITWGGNDRAAIDDVATVGFRGIQLRASAVTEWTSRPDDLVQLLKARNLTFVALSGGTVPLDPAKEADAIALQVSNAQFVRKAGGLYLQVVDQRPVGRAPEPDDFKRMGRLLTEIGKRTADVGVALGYHNHMGNLGQAPDEVAQVLDASDPRYVKLELDTAHYQAAGGDPVEAIRRHGDRLLFLHLKDLEKPFPGGAANAYRFVELGRGSVNLRGVFAELTRIGFDGWGIVELDRVPDATRTPRQSAEISKQHLASLGQVV
jgi:inosose dehydratase